MSNYLNKLAQRLLDKSYQSKEAEEQMLNKLKIEHGLKEVNRMSQMFKDIGLSAELKADFDKSQTGKGIKFDMAMEILQSNIWPNLEGLNCTLPKPLQAAVSSFEVYYKNKNSNRKLEWLFSQGNVEIITLYAPKKYQIIVTVAQSSILYLFNQQQEYNCKTLRDLTGLTPEVFKQCVMQLCNPKIKFLNYSGKKPVFEDNDTISVNKKYTSQNIRVDLRPVKSTKKKEVGMNAEEKE
jgi:hypothetical protein